MVLGSIAPSRIVRDDRTRRGTEGWLTRRMCGVAAGQESIEETLIPSVAGRDPIPLDDRPDFAHSGDIGLSDALAAGTAVAIGDEMVSRGLQQRALIGSRGGKRPPVLPCHVAVERRQSGVRADGDFTSASGLAAVEARVARVARVAGLRK